MIKKTPLEQLKPGMFISDLNAGWLAHPFLFNQLLLETEAQIAALRASGIREVYVDASRGLDVPHAPLAQEAAAVTEAEIRRTAEVQVPVLSPPVSVAEEFSRARKVYADATSLVRSVMQDARLGRPLALNATEEMVDKIVGSVLRNGSALMMVCRLRQQDDYTFRHSVNVAVLLVNLARNLGSDLQTLRAIGLGGLLHDVGKMLVDPNILNKPGRLTDEEFDHMRAHVNNGTELLRQTPGVPQESLLVLQEHHERFDGSGYPTRMQGRSISFPGRMAAVCDVYDAITSDRCYHQGINPAEAMRRLFEWSKYHFDAEITHAFVRSIGIYPVGALVRLESGYLAVVTELREASLLRPVVRVIFDARRSYYVQPRQIDLSSVAGKSEKIVGHEEPSAWGIDITRFLCA